ncbi:MULTISPECIES: MNIO family bufferin maturase [Pseudoalteromonas]|uniref:Uncharacterized protein n=2 Tax=Pseudoalteromonas TaxID=53246 RepID=A0A5S3VAT9_9GAMM|nr:MULTISPECIES: DUF692 domain-containing protein [Pseudoalteromonas]TMO66266.1 hypothetical protein CWC18_03460 [Pseudoalteromonas aurantia]TMO68628.1 hypothetical protein CWC19_08515 [Pseudoalteromonas aurantia]TMO71684.1 hypothetical protein CWC20_17100 [Pseudoalteromonas aurantia]
MSVPYLGFGMGLRTCYFEQILTEQPAVDWFEIISENYFVSGGKPWHYLSQIKEQYPIVMHGVSMSIGSTDALNFDYLKQLKNTIERVNPMWVSDHICFSALGEFNSHDLLPMPYTEEALDHLTQRISQVQDYLERPMIFENVSSYLTYKQSHMTEWEFLTQLHKQTGCQFLLDINNVYVSARNHGFSAMEYLNALPKQSIAQIHLAGHQDCESHIIDTHDQPVCDAVWSLFSQFSKQLPAISTMIERDDNFPPLSALLSELEQAKALTKAHWG